MKQAFKTKMQYLDQMLKKGVITKEVYQVKVQRMQTSYHWQKRVGVTNSGNQSIIVSEVDDEDYATPPEELQSVIPCEQMQSKLGQTPSRNLGGGKTFAKKQARSHDRTDSQGAILVATQTQTLITSDPKVLTQVLTAKQANV